MNKSMLFVTSFPPRQCGIATFAEDLVNALQKSFSSELNIEICALSEYGKPGNPLTSLVTSTLNPFDIDSCIAWAHEVNANEQIDLVCFEHEFGLYGGEYGYNLLAMLSLLNKPFIIRFHTVLPYPDPKCQKVVSLISTLASKVMVMTKTSADILEEVYKVSANKIVHIPHGTHARVIDDKQLLKTQYGLNGRLVLSTFGLISENKGLETGIRAMVDIARQFPNALYLILGKTHPTILEREGEAYRDRLEALVAELGLQQHVRFVNNYLSLEALLDYLSVTDLYLFTSIDPHQAVSGTFVYAMSAGCPIIATGFTQAKEMLDDSCGRVIGFKDHKQLADNAVAVLGNPLLREEMSRNAIEKTRSSLWDNVAISHMALISDILDNAVAPMPSLPPAYLDHVDRLTDEFGMIQFCKHDVPDPTSGYTLDDNARALISICMYAETISANSYTLALARKYLNFIAFCQQPDGRFFNYVNVDGSFGEMNESCNLEDANGRAIWALGYVLRLHKVLPKTLIQQAFAILQPCRDWIGMIRSPRAMAFIIKGLYYYLQYTNSQQAKDVLDELAATLLSAYRKEQDSNWKWYECYLTYGNAVLPEAMMMAYMITKRDIYRQTALETFEFLCNKTFTDHYMKVINNRTWHHKDQSQSILGDDGGEQSIEVAYTMMTLHTFYEATGNNTFLEKMRVAFSWYLGNNHLKQLIYNPITFGCYDGLEKNNVNQNQGAESSVCYLMARLLMEQWSKYKPIPTVPKGLEPAVRASIN